MNLLNLDDEIRSRISGCGKLLWRNRLVWRRTADPILASIFNGDVTIKNGGENWVCATLVWPATTVPLSAYRATRRRDGLAAIVID